MSNGNHYILLSTVVSVDNVGLYVVIDEVAPVVINVGYDEVGVVVADVVVIEGG